MTKLLHKVKNQVTRKVSSADYVVVCCAGAWLEVLQNLLAAMHIPHRIVIGRQPSLLSWQLTMQSSRSSWTSSLCFS